MTITCVDFQQGIGNGAEDPLGCYVTTSHLQVGDVWVLWSTAMAGGGGEFEYNQTTGGSPRTVTSPFGKSFLDVGPGHHAFASASGGVLSYCTIGATTLTGFSDGDGRIERTGWNNGLAAYATTYAAWTFRGGTIASGTEDDDFYLTDSTPTPWSTTLTAPALTAYQARFCCIVERSGWTQAGPAGVYPSTSMSPIGVERKTTDTDPLSLWNAGYGASTSSQTHRVTWTPYGAAEELTDVVVGGALPGYIYATHGPWYRAGVLGTITFTSPVTPVAEPQAVVPLYRPKRVNPAELPYQVTSGMVKRK